MKTVAHYDSKGIVRALVTTQGPDHITASLVPRPGNLAAEIDDLKIDPAKKTDLAEMRKVAQELKIAPARATRTKK